MCLKCSKYNIERNKKLNSKVEYTLKKMIYLLDKDLLLFKKFSYDIEKIE